MNEPPVLPPEDHDPSWVKDQETKNWIEYGLKKIFEAADHGGIWLAAIVAAFVAGIIIAVIYIRPVNEIPATQEVRVAPATGEQGYNVELLACDKVNKVDINAFVAPDASGVTYTLQRTLDGRTETVTLVHSLDGTWPYAKHFWEDDKQNSNSAYVSEKALKCIQDRAR